ncbi:MAG: TldD/PmbA family protein [Thermoanaerobaculales bacterium]|nr:TldD/PmbA family protein [Thermoanaerobaculales bacterium]
MKNEGKENVFDGYWLDELATWCQHGKEEDTGFEDLYLERRLELRLHSGHGIRRLEECRTEGAAARWRTPGRLEIEAATGISPRTIARLFQDRFDARDLRLQRPLPSPELDVPRGWREEAETLIDLCSPTEMTIHLLLRRAVVVRPENWHEIRAPLLVRIETGLQEGTTLLTTWNHPPLQELAPLIMTRASHRSWHPQSDNAVPVLFSKGTTGVLVHELVGHLLEGDLLASGASPLAQLNSQAVSTSNLHVIDDPTRFDLPGAFSCDDEGVPAQAVTLLEDGAVRGALCDRFSAAVLDREPGRGRRASWNAPPVPRLSNLVVPPGSTPPEDLEADIRNGLCVTRISGASVDPGAARLVIRVEQGWEIRHGRRRRPLSPCEITGTVDGVLSAIDGSIGNDPLPDRHLGWCMKGGFPLPTGSEAPSILVHTMEVL